MIENVLTDELLVELRELMGNLGSQPLGEGEDPENLLAKMKVRDYWSASPENGDPTKGIRNNYDCGMQSGSPHVQKVLPILAQTLMENQVFSSIGLVDCLFPPKFNKYEAGGFYNSHCDEPLARDGQGRRLRADLAFTLWLSNPEDYEGGELVINDGMSDPQSFKGKAGELLFYPATHAHKVNELESGTRYALVGWAQSLISDESLRSEVYRVNMLLNDLSIRGERELFVRLEAHRNQLLRLWSY
jgi:PKHD-type hydroxylase